MKIYVESMGCAKNHVDSEVLISIALNEGYEWTENAEEADLIVVNSCGFIESAKTESIETFFSLHNLNPRAKMVMAGCLAERYGKEMDLEEAHAIFGNRNLSEFRRVLRGSSGVIMPCFSERYEEERRSVLLGYKGSAYLKIAEGCNHKCSFCAIPGIRGPLRSKTIERIKEEAENLIEMGVKEIVLVAQDTASYGLDLYGKPKITELLDTLSQLGGNYAIRMLYIHPDIFPSDLIPLVKERKKIIPYFDLPFQHSDTRILRRMGRVGNMDKYLSLVNGIREEIPESVIRTTLMVGFPGEDEKSIESITEFVKNAQFDWMGAFTYSREEGTAAHSLEDDDWFEKNASIAKKAKRKLEKIQEGITRDRLSRFTGKEFNALIEERIEGEELAIGRIYSQAPEVDGLTVIMGRDMEEGNIVRVGITGVAGIDLEGVKIGNT